MKETVSLLLSQQVQCVLATIRDKEISLHLMAYAFSDALDEIYVASLEETQKVRNMRLCADVTLLWDNRTGNFSDHVEGLAMSGFGEARELRGQDARSGLRLLHKRNESLASLLAEPSVVIFAVHIDRYQWVEGYTRSLVYEPGKEAFA